MKGRFLLSVFTVLLCCSASPEEPKNEKLPTIKGRVLAVQKELHAVVLDVGEANGVTMGQSFKVYRGDTFLGYLRINALFPDMAVAAVVQSTQALKDGDQVTTRFLSADTAKESPAPPPPKSAGPDIAGLPKTVGKVLVIDRLVKLAVISLGAKEGIKVGQEVSVTRREKWIAALVVQEVKETMSVTRVKLQNGIILEGDRVLVRE